MFIIHFWHCCHIIIQTLQEILANIANMEEIYGTWIVRIVRNTRVAYPAMQVKAIWLSGFIQTRIIVIVSFQLKLDLIMVQQRKKSGGCIIMYSAAACVI